MSIEMKICSICKTPIEEGLEIFVKEGIYTHPGVCYNMLTETANRLNESDSSVKTEEIQMIL